MAEKGKRICDTLKSVRKEIAEKNGIPYETHECHFEGECQGTCPRCESEVRYLERELEKKKRKGLQVAIAGISAGLVATVAAGCRTLEVVDDLLDWAFGGNNNGAYQLAGDVPMVTDPEDTGEIDIELGGDVCASISTEDLEALVGEVAPVQEEEK